MASSMVTTILPIYIVFILHEGVDKLGFVIALATFVSYAFRILFGYISDRYQIVKPLVVTGYFISAITKPMLYFTNSWHTIALLRGVERIGKSVRSASKDKLISNYAATNKSGATFGFHKTLDIAGELSGALITFVVFWQLGKNIEIFQALFAWTLLPGILATLIVLFFVHDSPTTPSQETKVLSIRPDYRLLPMLGLYFGFTFFMFDTSFYLIKAKELGYGMELIPLLIVFLTLVQTLFSYVIGVKVDEFGAKKVLIIAFGFGIIAMGSLYLDQVILAFLFLGIFLVASLNSLRSHISDHAHNKATVYGFLYGGVAISASLGAMMIGLIWQHFGEHNAILVALSGAIFIFTLTLVLYKRLF